jgi:hypothetical protein
MGRRFLYILLFLHLAAVADPDRGPDAAAKGLDTMIKAISEICPSDRAKEIEAILRRPPVARDSFQALLLSLEKGKSFASRHEMKEYIRRVHDYYRAHLEAILALQKSAALVSDRLFHLVLEDFSEILARAIGEFAPPTSHLSVGTAALLRRQAIAVERFCDRRLELYAEDASVAKSFDPGPDDRLIDNIHFLMALLQIPVTKDEKNAFTDRDARSVHYLREAIHALVRETSSGQAVPLKIAMPLGPAR